MFLTRGYCSIHRFPFLGGVNFCPGKTRSSLIRGSFVFFVEVFLEGAGFFFGAVIFFLEERFSDVCLSVLSDILVLFPGCPAETSGGAGTRSLEKCH